MAVVRRQPAAGLVHHSDQGSQYVSQSLASAGARPASTSRWERRAPRSTTRPANRSSARSRRNSSASAAGQEERAEERDLRVDRGLVQPAPAALDARVPPTAQLQQLLLDQGGDGEGSCLARRSPPKRGGPSCSARFLCHASACESERAAPLGTTAVASSPARSTAARSSSRMSGTLCGGWPTRPSLSAGFIRTRYATPTPLNGSRGHTHERLARSARPSLPGDYGPIPTGRGPCPGHRDDEAQGVELGLVGSTQRCAAHLVRRLHMRLHGIEVADRGVGVIFVGLQGFHHGRAR